MNVFIVYAHPEPKSFNCAMKDLAVAELISLGHSVKVSDLYAMRFKAVADKDDFLELSDADFLKYAAEQKHASETKSFSADIQEEQEKLLWANFVIFQFPLWWYSVPAIMKGWFDRVFASGFIYGGNFGRYDTGRLAGRKAMLSLSTGSPKGAYMPHGMDGEMRDVLYPIHHGILYFSGMRPVEPYVAWTPSHDAEERKGYLEEYRERIRRLQDIPEIRYRPTSHYDEHHVLKAEHRYEN
jgi:NAD(P)H dehydrogenase (quinone)